MSQFLKKYLLIILFCAVLLVPSLGGLFIEPDVSAENRALTSAPQWKGLGTLSEYEMYLTDRIAFRSELIQASALIDYFVFQKSIAPNVLIGDNGQLFYNEKNELIDTNEYLLGNTVVAEECLDGIVSVQNEIQAAMDERGIQYLVVIAPTKQAVYPEDLPAYYRGNKENDTVKNQILERLKQETDVEILDLTDAMLDEKQQHPVYLKTDSHWNYFGSFRGYEEIIKSLQTSYPNLPLLSRDMFQYSMTPEYGQNLAKMISLGDMLADENAVRFNPEIPMVDAIVEVPRNYPDPNYGSPEFRMIVTEQPDRMDLPSAILYRDSFAGLDGWTIGNLNRYLPTAFSSFASYAQYQIDFNYIDVEKPDIVIWEVYEDNIYRLGINCLHPGQVSADRPLYNWNTTLNGEYYIANEN